MAIESPSIIGFLAPCLEVRERLAVCDGFSVSNPKAKRNK